MIRIITDSMSDLTQQEAQAQDFRVLPLTVRFGQEEFLDSVTLNHEAFYQRLATVKELPKTSQVTPRAFTQAFQAELADPTNEVLCITGSSKLSGTFQSAMLARDSLPDPERVHLLDSASVSMGEALLVRLALVHRSTAKDAAALKATLEGYMLREHVIGKADTLKYLVMGGRLSVLGGAVGSVLHIKPLLRIQEGALVQAGICRGSHRAMEWFVKQLEEHRPDPAVPMILAHAHAPEAASEMQAYITAHLAQLPPIMNLEIGTVVGTHGGPGIIGLAWVDV